MNLFFCGLKIKNFFNLDYMFAIPKYICYEIQDFNKNQNIIITDLPECLNQANIFIQQQNKMQILDCQIIVDYHIDANQFKYFIDQLILQKIIHLNIFDSHCKSIIIKPDEFGYKKLSDLIKEHFNGSSQLYKICEELLINKENPLIWHQIQIAKLYGIYIIKTQTLDYMNKKSFIINSFIKNIFCLAGCTYLCY